MVDTARRERDRDQNMGGVVMLAVGGAVYLLGGLILMARLLERRARGVAFIPAGAEVTVRVRVGRREILIAGIALFAGGMLLAWSGLINVAASGGHWRDHRLVPALGDAEFGEDAFAGHRGTGPLEPRPRPSRCGALPDGMRLLPRRAGRAAERGDAACHPAAALALERQRQVERAAAVLDRAARHQAHRACRPGPRSHATTRSGRWWRSCANCPT